MRNAVNKEDRETLNELIGARIREARQCIGYSQDAIASHMGHVGRGWVSHIEHGRKNITVYELVEIAKAIDIDVRELLEGL